MTHQPQHTALVAEAYRKVRKGESLTDAEINTTLEVLRPHLALMRELGQIFRLYCQEIEDIIRILEGYQYHRKQK